VFLPILFVQQEAGQLFRDIALAISSAVGVSLLISVTVIPTSTARSFRKGSEGLEAAPAGRFSSGGMGRLLARLDHWDSEFVRYVI